MQKLKEIANLKDELRFLGLLDKAREIYLELGQRAVLSYIKSSYKLLSKVYHPDLNPENREVAKKTQQRLNRVRHLVSHMNDEELIEVIKGGAIKKAGNKKKILVVEDEFGLQGMFRDVFLMEGYDTRVAENGDQGYREYQQFEPDLVFTDVVMPVMTGLEMVKKIRELNPGIKVIYISGFLGIRTLKRDLDEEVLRYGYPTISKPCKMSVILDLVREYLKDNLAHTGRVSIFV